MPPFFASASQSRLGATTSPVIRVLLIDDDEDEWLITRDLLREVEQGVRFKLDWVPTYDAGVEALTRSEHDIYLIDYRLGTRSGLDLLRQATQMGIHAPMILLTGQGDPGVDAAAAEAGAADYLVKDGLDAALLERAIRYAIAQKRAQEALREAATQNARLSAAIANADVGVIITDLRAADHSITFVNPGFEAISGYTAAESIGRSPRFLQGPETDPAIVSAISEALATGQPFEGILLNYRKDGTPFWNGMHISPVKNDEGQIESWIGFMSDVTAKIEAEKALRESRENLAAAQRLTHLGSWTVELNPPGQFENIRITWSDEVYRIMGLDPQSVIPTAETFYRLIHAEDREAAINTMKAAARGEVPFDLEYRIVRADGSERMVHVRGELEWNAEGQISRILGTTHDITESRQDQIEARESRRRLQSVVKSAPLLIWSLDPNGVVTFIEGQVLESMETNATQYVGRSIFDSAGIDSKAAALARRALAGEEASGVVEVLGLVFDTKYSPLRNEKGEVTGAVGVATNITSRLEAEQAFRLSESRLSAVLDVVPILIWAIDTNGIFTLSQGRALETLGLKQGEAIGRSVFDMYGTDTAVAQMVRRALGGEESQVTLEVGPNIFDVRYTPTRDEENKVTGVVGVSYDITERVKAQLKLEESEARFVRVVANAPGMVYRFHRALSGKMSFLYVSDGCRDIYGVEAEEVKRDAQILIEVIDPDDLASFYETVFESERDLTPWDWEGRVLRTDGDMRWIRGQARPARMEDGSTVWDGLVVDITESRSAQMELLRNRSALNEAQKLARIGSFEWNLISGEVTWSDQMFRLFGFEPGAFQPTYHSIFEFSLPEERENVQRQSDEAIAAGLPASIMVRVQRQDGEVRVLQTHSRVETDGNNRVFRLVGSAQDVTESVESQRALQESEQRYAFAAQGANDGLWDWNLQTDCIYLSPRWKMMLGHNLSEISDSPEEWFSRVHPDDLERLRTTLNLHLSGESSHFECEYRLRSSDGSYRWMLGRGLAVFEGDQAHRIAGSQTDITERKIAEAQLSRNAFYDTLTGLPNRALFLDRLDSTLARAQRNPEYTYAVLFLDIDRFKKINDSLGHLPGDQLLIEAAARFESCLRPGDTVARLGGDEFAVLIDDIRDAEDVNLVAGRIQKALETPFLLEGKEVFVTVSIGVAPSRGAQDRPDELLRNADTAMYRAKSLGRARHEVFDATMHQRAVKMLELETDLWRAIERDELRLHYQPIIDLKEGKVSGFEALIRWQHPERGLVSPGDFIPLAEETGLIIPIGWWVLGEACRQAKAWAELFESQEPLTMSVNLSTKQFSQSDLIQKVQEIVAESGFDPRHLKLEITESVIMENTESANAMLLELKALGIRLSMDDFGTGYSSLSYLHRFPLDTLKIDRSFVSQMRPHSRDGEIVGTILSLASGLGMVAVAEGVETEEQLFGLRQMGCDFAQGFFFSKPLPRERIEELMAQNPAW